MSEHLAGVGLDDAGPRAEWAESRPRPRAARAWRPVILVASCLFALAVNVDVVANQLLSPMPVTPWEAGMSAEAWRSARHEPAYGAIDGEVPVGHMYGPLATWLQGRVVSAFGFSTPATRVPSLVASLLMAILVCKLGGARGWLGWLLAWTLAWGMNYRVSNIFAENRPDAPAFLFAVAGLWGLAAGYRSGRALPYAAGLASVIVGFFFKQTAAVAAPVFLAAVLIDVRRPLVRRVALGALPMLAVFATILAIRLAWPDAYRAMVSVPSRYRVAPRDVARSLWGVLQAQPLLWVVLLASLRRGRPLATFARRLALVAAVVTLPAGTLAAAKHGGSDNSLLPYYLATAVLMIERLPALFRLLRHLPAGGRRAAGEAVVGLLVILTTFPNPGRHVQFLLPGTARARAYREAVSWLAAREGPAVSPEDPTILILARGRCCRNAYLERDARPAAGYWEPGIPRVILDDLAAARLVVSVESFATLSGDLVDGPSLEKLGFVKVESNPYYSLWSRK